MNQAQPITTPMTRTEALTIAMCAIANLERKAEQKLLTAMRLGSSTEVLLGNALTRFRQTFNVLSDLRDEELKAK